MGIKRSSQAKWTGSVTEGKGDVALGSGAFEGEYSFNSRFGDDIKRTNPEELVAAAHSACYSMALTAALGRGGFSPASVDTKATVHLEKIEGGFEIPKIDLVTVAEVADISDDEFQTIAKAAKENCPISKVLAGAEITLDASLK
ncbi:MAG TPA: OsmC family protein [Pyrinomonadaceae bacterium]|nr:OsmC family protein [Pyrinomonadaceae bacterium]